ncbi:hypothetical protein pb186bvf_004661 [Paramecium bursaria]
MVTLNQTTILSCDMKLRICSNFFKLFKFFLKWFGLIIKSLFVV